MQRRRSRKNALKCQISKRDESELKWVRLDWPEVQGWKIKHDQISGSLGRPKMFNHNNLWISTVENFRASDVIHIFGIVVHLSASAKFTVAAKAWRFTTLSRTDPFKGDLLCQVVQCPQLKLCLIKKQMLQNWLWHLRNVPVDSIPLLSKAWQNLKKETPGHTSDCVGAKSFFNIAFTTIAGSQECYFVPSYFQCGWSCVIETSQLPSWFMITEPCNLSIGGWGESSISLWLKMCFFDFFSELTGEMWAGVGWMCFFQWFISRFMFLHKFRGSFHSQICSAGEC